MVYAYLVVYMHLKLSMDWNANCHLPCRVNTSTLHQDAVRYNTTNWQFSQIECVSLSLCFRSGDDITIDLDPTITTQTRQICYILILFVVIFSTALVRIIYSIRHPRHHVQCSLYQCVLFFTSPVTLPNERCVSIYAEQRTPKQGPYHAARRVKIRQIWR